MKAKIKGISPKERPQEARDLAEGWDTPLQDRMTWTGWFLWIGWEYGPQSPIWEYQIVMDTSWVWMQVLCSTRCRESGKHNNHITTD